MLPFNLEAAKSGSPIMTRDGNSVRFIGHVPESIAPNRLVVMIERFPFCTFYYEDGRRYPHTLDDKDLCMKTQHKTIWLNLHRGGKAFYHDSEQAAKNALGLEYMIAVAIPIEIEF